MDRSRVYWVARDGSLSRGQLHHSVGVSLSFVFFFIFFPLFSHFSVWFWRFFLFFFLVTEGRVERVYSISVIIQSLQKEDFQKIQNVHLGNARWLQAGPQLYWFLCNSVACDNSSVRTRVPSAISQSKIEFFALDLLYIKIVLKPQLTNKIV